MEYKTRFFITSQQIAFLARRRLFASRAKISQSPSSSTTKAQRWLLQEEQKKIKRKTQEEHNKLRNLKSFSKQLSKKAISDSEKLQDLEKELDIVSHDSLIEEDVSGIMNELNISQPEVGSLISPKIAGRDCRNGSIAEQGLDLFAFPATSIKLPSKLLKRIGSAVKYIKDDSEQSWRPVIDDLYNKKRGLTGLTQYDATRLIQSIPNDQKCENIALIHEMIHDAGIVIDRYLYDLIMSSYSVDAKFTSVVEAFYEQMKQDGWKPSIHTFGSLVKSFSKSGDLSKVQRVVKEMQTYDVAPNQIIYTAILQACIKAKSFAQSDSVFDLMKFVSMSTKPDSKTYSSIIINHVLQNNIERGLDLYDEMQSDAHGSITPEGPALLALARGCSMRKELAMRGWDFIFEYYDKKYPVNVSLMETMLCMASRNGDVNFARSLYATLAETRYRNTSTLSSPSLDTGPIVFNLLLRAYSKANLKSSPVSLLHDKASVIREKTIELFNCNFHPLAPPLLPKNELKATNEILAEAKALWAYNILHFKTNITPECLNSFLLLFATRGKSLQEFVKLWEQTTFSVAEDISGSLHIEDPEGDIHNSEQKESVGSMEQIFSHVKFPRTHEVYNIAIISAVEFADITFAQKIWVERGNYRKCYEFRSLSPEVKKKKDFQFARYMIAVFTRTGLLEDAANLVRSTESQFNWEWSHLRSFFQKAEQIGDESAKRTIRHAIARS